MGLDVSLYKYQNFKDTKRREKEYEEGSERIWNTVIGKDVKYEDATEAKKAEWSKQTDALAKKLNLDKYGSAKKEDCTSIEDPHPKYPDHLFKIGYWRSSYNESGINHVLENTVGESLYTIVPEANNKEYEIQPNWERVRRNAIKAHKKLKTHMEKYGALRVIASDRPFHTPTITSEAEAMEAYRKEVDTNKSDFEWYSNRNGTFMMKDPMKVVAILPGTRKMGFSTEPTVYLVFQAWEQESYLQALEIVEATADYVLAQPDKDKYYLHWSG